MVLVDSRGKVLRKGLLVPQVLLSKRPSVDYQIGKPASREMHRERERERVKSVFGRSVGRSIDRSRMCIAPLAASPAGKVSEVSIWHASQNLLEAAGHFVIVGCLVPNYAQECAKAVKVVLAKSDPA